MERLAYGYFVYKLFKSPQQQRQRRRTSVPILSAFNNVASIASMAHPSAAGSRPTTRHHSFAEQGRKSPYSCRSATPQRSSGNSSDGRFLACPPNNRLSASSVSVYAHRSVPENEEVVCLRKQSVRGAESPPPRRKSTPKTPTTISVPDKFELETRRKSLMLDLSTGSPQNRSRAQSFKFGGRLIARPSAYEHENAYARGRAATTCAKSPNFLTNSPNLSAIASSAETSPKAPSPEIPREAPKSAKPEAFSKTSSKTTGSKMIQQNSTSKKSVWPFKLQKKTSARSTNSQRTNKESSVELSSGHKENYDEDEDSGDDNDEVKFDSAKSRSALKVEINGQTNGSRSKSPSFSPRTKLSFWKTVRGTPSPDPSSRDTVSPQPKGKSPSNFLRRLSSSITPKGSRRQSKPQNNGLDQRRSSRKFSKSSRSEEFSDTEVDSYSREASSASIPQKKRHSKVSSSRSTSPLSKHSSTASSAKLRKQVSDSLKSTENSGATKSETPPSVRKISKQSASSGGSRPSPKISYARGQSTERETSSSAHDPCSSTSASDPAGRPTTSTANHYSENRQKRSRENLELVTGSGKVRWSLMAFWKKTAKQKSGHQRPASNKIPQRRSVVPNRPPDRAREDVEPVRRLRWLQNYSQHQDSRSRLIWGSQESRDTILQPRISVIEALRNSALGIPLAMADQNCFINTEPLPRRQVPSTSTASQRPASSQVDRRPRFLSTGDEDEDEDVIEDGSSSSAKRNSTSQASSSRGLNGPNRSNDDLSEDPQEEDEEEEEDGAELGKTPPFSSAWSIAEDGEAGDSSPRVRCSSTSRVESRSSSYKSRSLRSPGGLQSVSEASSSRQAAERRPSSQRTEPIRSSPSPQMGECMSSPLVRRNTRSRLIRQAERQNYDLPVHKSAMSLESTPIDEFNNSRRSSCKSGNSQRSFMTTTNGNASLDRANQADILRSLQHKFDSFDLDGFRDERAGTSGSDKSMPLLRHCSRSKLIFGSDKLGSGGSLAQSPKEPLRSRMSRSNTRNSSFKQRNAGTKSPSQRNSSIACLATLPSQDAGTSSADSGPPLSPRKLTTMSCQAYSEDTPGIPLFGSETQAGTSSAEPPKSPGRTRVVSDFNRRSINYRSSRSKLIRGNSTAVVRNEVEIVPSTPPPMHSVVSLADYGLAATKGELASPSSPTSKWEAVRRHRHRLSDKSRDKSRDSHVWAGEEPPASPLRSTGGQRSLATSPCAQETAFGSYINNKDVLIVESEPEGRKSEEHGLKVPQAPPASLRGSFSSLLLESDIDRSGYNLSSRRSSTRSVGAVSPNLQPLESRSDKFLDSFESISKVSLERTSSAASSTGSMRSARFAERSKVFQRQSLTRMSTIRQRPADRRAERDKADASTLGMLLEVGGEAPEKKKVGPMPQVFNSSMNSPRLRNGMDDTVDPAEVLVTLAFAKASGHLSVNIVRGRLFPSDLDRCEIHATLIFDGIHAIQKTSDPVENLSTEPLINRAFMFILQPKFISVASLTLQFWAESNRLGECEVGAVEFGAGAMQQSGAWHWAKIQERTGIPFPMWHKLIPSNDDQLFDPD